MTDFESGRFPAVAVPPPVTVIFAEDDDEDWLLIQSACRTLRLANPIHRVGDGEALMAYFKLNPGLPCLLFLDLNMPKMNGYEVLEAMSKTKDLSLIPTVVLTTSKQEQDILKSYLTGAKSYIVKPVQFGDLVKALGAAGKYWLEVVEIPRNP